MIARTVYDADHDALRDSVRRFLVEQAVPQRERWDSEGIDPSFWADAEKYGFVGLAGEDLRFAAVVLEEAMTAGLPTIALTLAIHEAYAPLLSGRGVAGLVAVIDEGVRAAHAGGAAEVPGGATGVGDAARDGRWLLSGAADAALNGMGAELLLVPVADGSSDLLFVVEPTAPGVHRSPADTLLGLDGADVADLRFDAVAAERLDADPAAARATHHLLLAVAAMAGAREALRITVDYVKQRKAFGRPIAEFENTQRALSGLAARITAAGAYVDHCLAAALNPAAAAAAKLVAADTLAEAVDTGVQLHGGYGYMWEYPIARAYAAARFFRLHAPTGDQLARAIGL